MINIKDYRCPHIEQIYNPSKEDFIEKYGLPGIPVCVLGAMKEWNATLRWTPDYFRNQHGSVAVEVSRTNDPEDKLTMSMADYMNYMENAMEEDPYYLRYLPIEDKFIDLTVDYEIPEYFACWLRRLPAENRPKWNYFFIGPANSNTRMHIETMGSSSWNAVISGCKLWLFFPPGQEEFLYSGEVDAFNPELSRFPLFTHAECLMCVQKAGEVVFTPSGWFHQVINVQTCISIAGYFINESNANQVKAYIAGAQLSDKVRQVLRQYIPELCEDIAG